MTLTSLWSAAIMTIGGMIMTRLGEIKRGRQIGHRDGKEYIWANCIDCGKERWVEAQQVGQVRLPKSLLCKCCVRKGNKWGKGNRGKSGFKGLPAHLLTGQARLNWIDKCRLTKLEANNPMWKGDLVGYNALHDWVKYRFPKPSLCENCSKEEARDLANKSGQYSRDLSDWWWLCRHCHMKIDGRTARLAKMRIKDER